MRKFSYLFFPISISLLMAGCAKTAGVSAAAPDPNAAADGNLAPVNGYAPPAQQPTPQGQYQYQAAQAPYPAPPPAYDSSYDTAAYQDVGDDSGQVVYASEPPPPLPAYSQPPCPGDNYQWTPGYWAWGNTDYYWVPGAWVLAPYVDALWTPPYWDFYESRYRWHRGYWGSTIGFYGGVNYGFGYTGRGFYGGYWNGGNFAYNTAVTNVNVAVVHNVYRRDVTNFTPVNRISYNGGPGGVSARPIPAEVAALREARTPPVAAQVQHERAAASNRQQFAAVNRGRPVQIAQAQPLPTSYRAPAARPSPAEQLRPIAQNRPQAPLSQNQRQQNEPIRNQPEIARPQPGQPAQEGRPFGPQGRPAPGVPPTRPNAPELRPEQRPVPQPAGRLVAPEPRSNPIQQPAARPVAPPERPQRPIEQPRPEPQRPVPQVRNEPPAARPAPAPAPRPQPAARPAPAPAPRPGPAARPAPAPAPRPEPAARPAPAPAPRPEPAARPAPAPAPRPAPAAPAARPAPKPEEKEKH